MKKASVMGVARLYACAAFLFAFLAGLYGFAAPALVSAGDTLLCILGGVLAVGVGPAAGVFGLACIAKLWRKVSR